MESLTPLPLGSVIIDLAEPPLPITNTLEIRVANCGAEDGKEEGGKICEKENHTGTGTKIY
jgi:hypothetical protein